MEAASPDAEGEGEGKVVWTGAAVRAKALTLSLVISLHSALGLRGSQSDEGDAVFCS